MKKFDRLSPEERKQEIRAAAGRLFAEKGFGATTMENIVEQVSLSKGGVYRIYGSTEEILSDLILEGMRLRNAYYEQRVRQRIAEGKALDLSFLIEIIGDSLRLYPEIAAVYVEFLWEKQRRPRLEALYQQICRISVEETAGLMARYGADDLLRQANISLERLTDVMNGAVLCRRVLGLKTDDREKLCRLLLDSITLL